MTFASKGVAGAEEAPPFITGVVAALDVGAASLEEGSLLILFGDTGAD